MTAPVPSENSNDFDPQNEAGEADYVPEREFVLMPFFRRVGQMLGLRTREQNEVHVEPTVPDAPILREPIYTSEPSSQITATEVARSLPQPAEANAFSGESGDVLRLEEPEQAFSLAHETSGQAETSMLPEAEERELPVAPLIREEASAENQVEVQAATTQPTNFQPSGMILALREATAKVLSAIERAADWLREKEDAILREANSSPSNSSPASTQPPFAPEPLHNNETDYKPVAEPESSRVVEAERQPQQAESWLEESWTAPGMPALQQEMAWREPSHETRVLRGDSGPDFARISRSPEPIVAARSALQSRSPRVPIWKQIDWSHQFTPKRVAVIGGLVMAALLAIGMSLARRPASSILPQQSRAPEPGGVTLTAHPRPLPAQTAENIVQQKQPAPSHPTHHAPRYGEGPDVVTHYYTHGKPSPVHQSTVAGVRHYSDME